MAYMYIYKNRCSYIYTLLSLAFFHFFIKICDGEMANSFSMVQITECA